MRMQAMGAALAVAGAFALYGAGAVPAAANPFEDLYGTYQFPEASDQAVNLSRALLVKKAEEGFYDEKPHTNQYNWTHIDDLNHYDYDATSIGNQTVQSCSGHAYCNADQENEDSTQNAQANLNDGGNAGQAIVNDDVSVDVNGGGPYYAD